MPTHVQERTATTIVTLAAGQHDSNWRGVDDTTHSPRRNKNIIPHQTSCLHCVFPQAPPSGTAVNCATAGILSSTVAIIAALECSEALKLLTGQGHLNQGLIHMDVWENSFEVLSVEHQEQDCPACGKGRYEFL